MNDATRATVDDIQRAIPMRDWALHYASHGWAVLPLREKGKAPLTKNGVKDATTDLETISKWWTDMPAANIGIATGARSNLLVLDVDGDEGREALRGLDFPETPHARTGRGDHLFFQHVEGLRTTRTHLFPEVDTRGEGGYIVAPPSVHPNGTRYEWTEGRGPWHVPPAPPPDWLIDSLRDKPCVPREPESALVTKGQRNNHLTRLAGAMRKQGANADTMFAGLWAENQTKCNPPLPEQEVRRIAVGMERYPPAVVAPGPSQDEPLADPLSVRIDPFLDREPPPRRYLLDNLLGYTVGALVAGGGTGKSYAIAQLHVALATGRPWLGVPIAAPAPSLMITAEDDTEEVHRRVRRIVDSYGLSQEELQRLRDNLFIAVRVGEDNRITSVVDRTPVRTEIGRRIAVLAHHLPQLGLISIDPISRFRGGIENDNDDATRFVEALESLRAETDAAILCAHHMNKGAAIGGAERLGPETVRGASALSDGMRFVAAMATLRRDDAHRYGLDPEDAGRYVRLDVVKNNYAPPWPGVWLERTAGGVLVPTTLERQQNQRQEVKADNRYREVLPKLHGLVRQHQERGAPLTRNKLRNYAGKAGLLGVGDQTLRGILERAIAENQIAETETGDRRRGAELRTWK